MSTTLHNDWLVNFSTAVRLLWFTDLLLLSTADGLAYHNENSNNTTHLTFTIKLKITEGFGPLAGSTGLAAPIAVFHFVFKYFINISRVAVYKIR